MRPLIANWLTGVGLLQHIPSLGQLTLQWRTESGGVGTLCDYALTNVPRPMQPLEVRLVSFPPSVEVCWHPFEHRLP